MQNPAEVAQTPALAGRLLERIRTYAGPPATLMEVCGTHTVAIARMGLRRLLPPSVRLISGPGCPVCVTPVDTIDEAIHLARVEGAILATYGDALRVPGSASTLAEEKARGADVRVVYSASDALGIARGQPDRPVVLLGLGFETTSPTVAWTLREAREAGVSNFYLLSAHKALLPAMEALVRDPGAGFDAFLCPGHASMVLGTQAYERLAEEYGVPCVIAGFEPNDILLGILQVLRQVENGEARVENAYPRAVGEAGNPSALRALDEVFVRVDARWRGLGTLPGSGYEPGEAFAAHDARRRFLAGVSFPGREPPGCRCAEVLRGVVEPAGCPLFALRCTPEAPVGACMVSSEGACGAHYRYREA